MLKVLLVGCALGGTRGGAQTVPAPAQTLAVPAHPATVAQIHEYYRLTNAIALAHKVLDQMVTGMQATSASYYPASLWDDMRASFKKVDLEAAYIPAYQRYFSEEDMAQMLQFYASPAGQRLLVAQPLIIAEAQEVMRGVGETLGQQVYERHKGEIEAAKARAQRGADIAVPKMEP